MCTVDMDVFVPTRCRSVEKLGMRGQIHRVYVKRMRNTYRSVGLYPQNPSFSWVNY